MTQERPFTPHRSALGSRSRLCSPLGAGPGAGRWLDGEGAGSEGHRLSSERAVLGGSARLRLSQTVTKTNGCWAARGEETLLSERREGPRGAAIRASGSCQESPASEHRASLDPGLAPRPPRSRFCRGAAETLSGENDAAESLLRTPLGLGDEDATRTRGDSGLAVG